MTDHQSLAKDIATAIREHAPLPTPPSGMDFESAYKMQQSIAELVSPTGFAGIKAGMTSLPLQKNFGIDHPLLGRLYEAGRLANGALLPFIEGQILECEIGIILNEQLQPAAAALTVEFAFLKFANAVDTTAINLVASNVATDAFLAGEQHRWENRENWSDTTVRLYRDDELINEADILDSMGGPAKALDWIRPEAARFAIPLTAGDLVMTGACGKVVPALPGVYRVICGALGELGFTISQH